MPFSLLCQKAPPNICGGKFEVLATVAEAFGQCEAFFKLPVEARPLTFFFFESTTSDIIGSFYLDMHP